MGASAWVMFLIGAVLLWGGLAFFLYKAMKAGQKA
ncbi:hypothetical protein C8P63_11317 [Melghirimyces profundicolus]|uniref:Uncharacterized protein n=1 Tax=Melghirimyces profundicolus TaxID=1242148 RepID=A0A2T6BSM2_9BACL|nr:MetS family NSS transporter small subunit [Melghirimyces profundicolus]PTX59072.1 hypothetical protein C8P63_11317 [Melghirimyces profundicolus]